MSSNRQDDETAFDDEEPQHLLYMPDYYLAKTPVTNAHYSAFVLAAGREPPKGWPNRTPPRHEEDHPVLNVCWYNARDYCRWLSEVTGRGYDLPSEAEWEKGARGTNSRIYPWGYRWNATRCNSGDSGLRQTTSVYAYPQGSSPYRLLDMAGNVFEWTRSRWGTDWGQATFRYPYTPNHGREDRDASPDVFRVLRGGAFDSSPVHPGSCAVLFASEISRTTAFEASGFGWWYSRDSFGL
jgi:formylglycine-generating enzyme required for sulfatase activity